MTICPRCDGCGWVCEAHPEASASVRAALLVHRAPPATPPMTATRRGCRAASKPRSNAARYLQKLPKAPHDLPHWQDAVEHLMRASAGSPAWLMFARMFMLRALHHGKPAPDKEPRRKRVKVYRVLR